MEGGGHFFCVYQYYQEKKNPKPDPVLGLKPGPSKRVIMAAYVCCLCMWLQGLCPEISSPWLETYRVGLYVALGLVGQGLGPGRLPEA